MRLQTLCLAYIRKEWERLKPLERRDEETIPPPWGVWIVQYAPPPPNYVGIPHNHPIQQAWFMEQGEIRAGDVWAYRRFVTVNWERPWAAFNFRPQNKIWGLYHQIALSAFARLRGTEQIYLETQWGMRYGQGYRMEFDRDGRLVEQKLLWKS